VNNSVTNKSESGQMKNRGIKPDAAEVKKKRRLLRRLFGSGKRNG
jgi:hypothetical protein